MPLSDSILKIFKSIQQKPTEEKKKIQFILVIIILIPLLAIGVISLRWEFSKGENSFLTAETKKEGQRLGVFFRKMEGLGVKIKGGFSRIKENEEIKKILKNYAR